MKPFVLCSWILALYSLVFLYGCDKDKPHYKIHNPAEFKPLNETKFRNRLATHPNGKIHLSLLLPENGYSTEVKYKGNLKDDGDAIRNIGLFYATSKRNTVSKIVFRDSVVADKVEISIQVIEPTAKAQIDYLDIYGARARRIITLSPDASTYNFIDSYDLRPPIPKRDAQSVGDGSKGWKCIELSTTNSVRCYTTWDRTGASKMLIGGSPISKANSFDKNKVVQIWVTLLNQDETEALQDCPDEMQILTRGLDSLYIFRSPTLALPDFINATNDHEVKIPIFADSVAAYSLSLAIGYDPQAADFLGIEQEAVSGISAAAQNGVIKLGWYNVLGHIWPPYQNRHIAVLRFRSKGLFSPLYFIPQQTQATHENGAVITDLNLFNGSINPLP